MKPGAPWNLWKAAAIGLAIGVAICVVQLRYPEGLDAEFVAVSLILWPLLAVGLGAIRNGALKR